MIHKLKIAVALIVLTLGSCKQESEPVPADATISINLSSPVDGQVYNVGDTVWMLADVSYSTQMHGYALTIGDTSANAIFFNEEDHVHSDHFSINNYWIATSAAPKHLQVKLSVAANHEEAPTTTYRNIHIQ